MAKMRKMFDAMFKLKRNHFKRNIFVRELGFNFELKFSLVSCYSLIIFDTIQFTPSFIEAAVITIYEFVPVLTTSLTLT